MELYPFREFVENQQEFHRMYHTNSSEEMQEAVCGKETADKNDNSGAETDSMESSDVLARTARIYADWTNYYLIKGSRRDGIQPRITLDLQQDVRDGVLLADVIKAVTHEEVSGIVRQPRTAAEMVSNIQQCLDCLYQLGLPIDDVEATDIHSGNLSSILDLFFNLSRLKQQLKLNYSTRKSRYELKRNREGKLKKSNFTEISFPVQKSFPVQNHRSSEIDELELKHKIGNSYSADNDLNTSYNSVELDQYNACETETDGYSFSSSELDSYGNNFNSSEGFNLNSAESEDYIIQYRSADQLNGNTMTSRLPAPQKKITSRRTGPLSTGSTDPDEPDQQSHPVPAASRSVEGLTRELSSRAVPGGGRVRVSKLQQPSPRYAGVTALGSSKASGQEAGAKEKVRSSDSVTNGVSQIRSTQQSKRPTNIAVNGSSRIKDVCNNNTSEARQRNRGGVMDYPSPTHSATSTPSRTPSTSSVNSLNGGVGRPQAARSGAASGVSSPASETRSPLARRAAGSRLLAPSSSLRSKGKPPTSSELRKAAEGISSVAASKSSKIVSVKKTPLNQVDLHNNTEPLLSTDTDSVSDGNKVTMNAHQKSEIFEVNKSFSADNNDNGKGNDNFTKESNTVQPNDIINGASLSRIYTETSSCEMRVKFNLNNGVENYSPEQDILPNNDNNDVNGIVENTDIGSDIISNQSSNTISDNNHNDFNSEAKNALVSLNHGSPCSRNTSAECNNLKGNCSDQLSDEQVAAVKNSIMEQVKRLKSEASMAAKQSGQESPLKLNLGGGSDRHSLRLSRDVTSPPPPVPVRKESLTEETRPLGAGSRRNSASSVILSKQNSPEETEPLTDEAIRALGIEPMAPISVTSSPYSSIAQGGLLNRGLTSGGRGSNSVFSNSGGKEKFSLNRSGMKDDIDIGSGSRVSNPKVVGFEGVGPEDARRSAGSIHPRFMSGTSPVFSGHRPIIDPNRLLVRRQNSGKLVAAGRGMRCSIAEESDVGSEFDPVDHYGYVSDGGGLSHRTDGYTTGSGYMSEGGGKQTSQKISHGSSLRLGSCQIPVSSPTTSGCFSPRSIQSCQSTNSVPGHLYDNRNHPAGDCSSQSSGQLTTSDGIWQKYCIDGKSQGSQSSFGRGSEERTTLPKVRKGEKSRSVVGPASRKPNGLTIPEHGVGPSQDPRGTVDEFEANCDMALEGWVGETERNMANDAGRNMRKVKSEIHSGQLAYDKQRSFSAREAQRQASSYQGLSSVPYQPISQHQLNDSGYLVPEGRFSKAVSSPGFGRSCSAYGSQERDRVVSGSSKILSPGGNVKDRHPLSASSTPRRGDLDNCVSSRSLAGHQGSGISSPTSPSAMSVGSGFKYFGNQGSAKKNAGIGHPDQHTGGYKNNSFAEEKGVQSERKKNELQKSSSLPRYGRGEGTPAVKHSVTGSVPVESGKEEESAWRKSQCMNQRSNSTREQHRQPRSGAHSEASSRRASNREDDAHGSMLSLASNVSSVYSTPEEKQAQEVRKLKRELESAQEKISTLTTQLTTNVHVVTAFEQSLSNMTNRLQKLTAASEQKESELQELRTTLQNLQIQSKAQFSGGLHKKGSIPSAPPTPSLSPLHRQSSLSNGAPGRMDIAGLLNQHPGLGIHLSMDNVCTFGNVNPTLLSNCSLDKKHKKSSWLKTSITKAFSRRKASKAWSETENVEGGGVIIREAQMVSSVPNSPLLQTSSAARVLSTPNTPCVNASRQAQVSDRSGPVSMVTDSLVPGMDVVIALQQQLHDKDMKLTDIRLEALSSAHHLDSLRETMNKMKNEIISLKSDNERMQKMIEEKGLEKSSSDDSNNISPPNRISLEDPTKFDSIAVEALNKGGHRFTVAVQLGHSTQRSEGERTSILIGTINVTNKTNWESLDSSVRKIFKEHINRLDPGSGMGLSGSSVGGYSIGEITRTKGSKIPELLPCGYLVGENTTIILNLKDHTDNSVDSLSFETLIPKSIIQRYISLLLEHRRMILSGPSGTGKTYLAQKLAEYLVLESGKELSVGVIATFNVDQKSGKELRQYLSNIADQCEHNVTDLPSVIILDNLHHVSSLADAFNPLLGLKTQTSPCIIGTMNQSGSTTTNNLQLHHNFRWILCTNHVEPVRGFLSRYLHRQLVHETILTELSSEEVSGIIDWLPKVWQHVCKFLETHCSTDITIGPRLFLSCPMDLTACEVWFTDLWNYSIVPYVLEAVREGLQSHGQKAQWEDPTEWILETYPWKDRRGDRSWPSLLHLRAEDVGYDPQTCGGVLQGVTSPTAQNLSGSEGSGKADAGNTADPLMTMLLRLQEAASYSSAQSNESDSASLTSHGGSSEQLESADQQLKTAAAL